MRINKAKISINELLSYNKLFSFFLSTVLFVFFSMVRFFTKSLPRENDSITVIAMHRLGDTIFTIPALLEIQKQYGNNINIVCFPESEPLYKLALSDVNFCLLNRKDFSWNERFASISSRNKLGELNSSIIFDLTGSLVSASLIFNSKAKMIVGINGNLFKSIYDKYVKFRNSPQLKDLYIDAISPLVNLTKREELSPKKITINPNGSIIIHPFAGWKEKEWNFKKYVMLAEKLQEDYSVSLLIKGDEISYDELEEIKFSGIDLIQSSSVEELIQIIMDCSIFIGNDSGPVNIANFLGKPTFTIFGSTNPDYTVTRADHQKFIQRKIKCSNGKDDKCCLIGAAIYNCSGVQCMNFLTVDELYNNLIPLVHSYCNRKA